MCHFHDRKIWDKWQLTTKIGKGRSLYSIPLSDVFASSDEAILPVPYWSSPPMIPWSFLSVLHWCHPPSRFFHGPALSTSLCPPLPRWSLVMLPPPHLTRHKCHVPTVGRNYITHQIWKIAGEKRGSLDNYVHFTLVLCIYMYADSQEEPALTKYLVSQFQWEKCM